MQTRNEPRTKTANERSRSSLRASRPSTSLSVARLVACGGGWGRRRAGIDVTCDASVDVRDEIPERIAPRFLMSCRQMGIPACFITEERGILEQELIGRMTTADPEFVLPFLIPAQRRRCTVDLEPEIVFEAGLYPSD